MGGVESAIIQKPHEGDQIFLYQTSAKYRKNEQKWKEAMENPGHSGEPWEMCSHTRIIPFAFIRQASISVADSCYLWKHR